MRIRIAVAVTSALALTSVLSGCASGVTTGQYEVRLGYFPTMTHAPAIIAIDQGYFVDELDASADLTVQTFNSGSDAINALLGGGLDATFIGPLPAVIAHNASQGEGVRIVSGSTTGGAALVVQPTVDSLDDLAGERLATPGLGNTQDVAARMYLASRGFETDLDGGGDIFITPQKSGQTLRAFAAGDIAAAWVPEPYVSLLVDAGGRILVDESDLWEDGEFVTTHLVVRTELLRDHPDLVRALVTGTVRAIDYIGSDDASAKAIVSDALFEITQTRLGDSSFDSAWSNLGFTVDPIAASLTTSADRAEELGLFADERVPTEAIYDLSILNSVLASRGSDMIGLP